jgi:hypothetical protein
MHDIKVPSSLAETAVHFLRQNVARALYRLTPSTMSLSPTSNRSSGGMKSPVKSASGQLVVPPRALTLSTSQKRPGGGYIFSPRYDVSCTTSRAVAHAEAADKVLNSPPDSNSRVTWMGPGKATSVYVNAHDPRLDVADRIESRRRRGSQMREMQAFLEDVEGLLANAGVGEYRSPPASPGSSSCGRGSTPVSTPVSGRRPATSTQPRKAPLTKAEKMKRDEAEAIATSETFERLNCGDLLVSAYDGSAHDRDELLRYNDFVHDRMEVLIAAEEEAELRGAAFSPATSVHEDDRHSESQGHIATKPRMRRPASLPPLDQWNRLPPLVSAAGEPLDTETIRAANRQYNDDAHHCARKLMAFKCFRSCDFVEEFRTAALSP